MCAHVEFPQVLAVSIFDKYYLGLSRSLSDPDTVAFMLHKEGVIKSEVLTNVASASSLVTKQREILLNALGEAINMKHSSLQIFIAILCKLTGNTQAGQAIQKDYGKRFSYFNK